MSSAALQIHPRLRPTTEPPGPGSPRRPPLRVIEGGRAPARVAQQAVYRRRRLVAALAVLVMAATAFLLVDAVVTRTAGGGTPNPVAGTSAPELRVVQPGDTLWSIARGLDGNVDVRLVVDQLVDLNGRAPLLVGQRLTLP